jgi:hypothetical protein
MTIAGSESRRTDFPAQSFLISQIINRIATTTLAQVVAVKNAGRNRVAPPLKWGMDTAKPNPAALQVAQLIQRLTGGYYAHAAALEVARDPRANSLFSKVMPGQIVPVGFVARKDGTKYPYHFHHFLDQVQTNAQLTEDLQKTWMVGSLLTIGDALLKYAYFDRAPEIELVYHLRNGVAHGNRFHLDEKGLKRLRRYPAHNHKSPFRTDTSRFEIVAALKGQPVLFDYMGPADILDVLSAVSVYLWRMGHGEPLRPEYDHGL